MPSVDPAHPALPGHFPGHPLVPGVVLLDHMLDALAARHPGASPRGIQRVRFLQAVSPGEAFDVECHAASGHRVRLRCLRDGQPVAEATVLLAAGGDAA